MSSPVPTPPPPPPSPSPSPPMSRKLLGNFELPSDLEWLTKKRRTRNPPRVRRIPNPNDLDSLHEKFLKPSSDYSSRGLSPKLDVHNAHGSSYSLKIGPSGSTANVPSSCCPKPAAKPRSTSSKVQESKDKNVKVDREGKQSRQEKKKNGKGDEKERKNEKKMKEKEQEPNQEPRAERESKLPTFSRQLTFEEIAEDIEGMTGAKPTRKPTKRPSSVQRQVERVTPGSRLESIKRKRYKVGKDMKKGK